MLQLTGSLCGGRRRMVVPASILMCVCGVAWGQASGTSAPKDEPVLKGPAVDDHSVPGQRGKFGGPGQGKGKEREQALPPRLMIQAIEVLKKDSTPAEARLTDAQEQKIRAVQEEFRSSQREFVQANREEIVKLRSQLGPEARKKVDERLRSLPGIGGPGRGPGGADKALGRPDGKGKGQEPKADEKDDMMQQAAPAQQEAAIARLKELVEKAPDPKDAQTKAWAVLSDPQKAIVKKEIERLRMQGPDRKGGPKPDGAAPGGEHPGPMLPPGAIGPDGKLDMSKLPPRMRERLESLTPEQREAAIKRLQQKGRPGAGEKGGVKRERAEDGSKPAPSMDEVDVPKPDESSPK